MLLATVLMLVAIALSVVTKVLTLVAIALSVITKVLTLVTNGCCL